MRAGTVEFAIVGDTRQFDTSLRQSEETAKVYAQRTEKQFQKVKASLEDIARATGMPLAELKKLEEQAQRGLASTAASKDLDRLASQAGLSAEAIKRLELQMGLTQKQAQTAFSSMESAAKSLKTALGAIGIGIGLSEIAQALKTLGTDFFEAGVKATQMQKSFEAINGGSAAATREFEFLRSVANRLGQNFWDLTTSYKGFSAAAKESGYPLAETHKLFEATTKAAASLGLSTEQTQRVFMGFQQIISKGTVSMEEVRQQLGESLPGAFGMFAKAAGMSEEEFNKAVSSGDILAKDILPKLADIMGAKYPGEVSKALAAQNKFNEAWMDLKVNVAESGFLDAAADSLTRFGNILKDEGVRQGMNELARIMGSIAVSAATIAGWGGKVAGFMFPKPFGQAMLDELNKKPAPDLVERAMSMGGSSSAVSTAPQAAKYSKIDSEKILQGVSLAPRDDLNKAWAESLDKISKIQKRIDAGTLSTEDMNRAVGDQRKIWASIGEAQDKYIKGENKGQAKPEQIAKANAEATKLINEAKFKALEAEQAAGGGSKYDLERIKNAASYQKEIDGLEVKLVGFKGTEAAALKQSLEGFAKRELAARNAKANLDEWIESMKKWGDLETQIGQLGLDPSRVFSGGLDILQADKAKALNQAGKNQEEIARVNELYALKEIDLREKTLGDVAKFDDSYWGRRRDGLTKLDKFLQDMGVKEVTRQRYVALQLDDINKKQLEARIGTEDSFGSYLKDRLALNYGLYKSDQGRLLDTWAKTADSIIKAFDGIENAVSTVFGAGLTDIITGKFQGMQHYIDSMLSSLKQVLISWLADMAKIAMHNYIVVPIMGQIVGTEGSFDLSGAGAGSGSGSGFNLSSMSKYAGYAKDGYNLLGSTSSGAASLASEAAQGANFVGPSVSLAPAGVPGSAQLTTMGALGAGAAAGGIGYMAGGFIRPDNPMASYVGAGAGLAAGTIAGMAGFGMLASTGIGALVAIPAALVAGLATPETTKSSWNSAPGSGQAVFIINGDVVPTSYGVLKQTTSGMFGSQSTTHQTVFQAATGEMATAEQNAWTAATAGLNTFTSSLDIGSKQVEDATKGFVFPMTAVPSGMEAETYKNIANAETEYTLQNLGLIDSIKAVAKEGEYYIDTVTRIGSALSVADSITQATGFSFDRLTGSMDKIQSGDYISRLTDAAGSIEAVQTTLGLLTSHTMSNAGRTEAAIANMTEQANQHLIELGVSFDDFWNRMQAAMSGPIDPETFAAWGEAAKLVDQLNTLQKSMDSVNMAAKQFDASLSARALSAQGLTYQAQIVSILASQEAELTQARLDGASATQLARLAEVQAMEQAALDRQHIEQGETIRSGLAKRIADASGDATYWVTEAFANKQKDYLKIVWEYGYGLADLSNKAYDVEIQTKMAAAAESQRLAQSALNLDIQSRQLTLAGKTDEAGALKLVADQAEQYRNAIASGLGADDLDSLLQVQRDELTKYWTDLVKNLKDVAESVRKTVLDLRAGDKSPLGVEDRYALVRGQFDAYVQKGMTGDTAAISQAQGLASGVLDALMAITTDKTTYASGFNEITGALNSLANILVGVNQKNAIAQAEAAYIQAKTQAETAFRSTMEGQIAQGLAYTGAGAGAVGDLLISGYGYTGGLTVDAYLRANPGKISDYVGWFQQNYGMTGSGQFDAWEAMQTLIKGGISPSGTSDLYQAALAALDNLKAVRGYATGGLVSTPQLAMVAEDEPELIIPVSKLKPMGSPGNGISMATEIRALRDEVRQLREENARGQYAIAENTATTAKWMTKNERIGPQPTRTA